MMMPYLTLLGLLPIIGGIVVLAMPARFGKKLGLVFAFATLAAGLVAFFHPNGSELTEQFEWIAPIGAWYSLGLDGMSKILVLLTVVLVPIVMLAEWNVDAPGEEIDGVPAPKRWSGGAFFGHVLLLEGLALYCFMATDMLLFYIFFEATLIPMYFLIGGWGERNRAGAALKFLLFNLAGGLVMLFGVIGAAGIAHSQGVDTLLINDLMGVDFGDWGRVLFIAFFVAFAVKAPMVPVHTWLPEAASQARPGASVLMVGVLDKIGTFGMIRFCLGLFPDASKWASPVVLILALISIIYGALLAIGSSNMLRLVAYTSVSHFGFMVFGIFAFTTASLNGAILYMLAHGFSSAALFLVIGFLIERGGSVEVSGYGGVRKIAPVLAGLFLTAGLSTLALPGFASFVGEYLVMAGAFQRHPIMTIVAALGTVLAAVYVLLAYQRTMTGEPTDDVVERVESDLNLRERLVLAPLIGLLLVFGFVPNLMLDVAEPTAAGAMVQVGMSDPAPVVEGGK